MCVFVLHSPSQVCSGSLPFPTRNFSHLVWCVGWSDCQSSLFRIFFCTVLAMAISFIWLFSWDYIYIYMICIYNNIHNNCTHTQYLMISAAPTADALGCPGPPHSPSNFPVSPILASVWNELLETTSRRLDQHGSQVFNGI